MIGIFQPWDDMYQFLIMRQPHAPIKVCLKWSIHSSRLVKTKIDTIIHKINYPQSIINRQLRKKNYWWIFHLLLMIISIGQITHGIDKVFPYKNIFLLWTVTINLKKSVITLPKYLFTLPIYFFYLLPLSTYPMINIDLNLKGPLEPSKNGNGS